MFYSCGLPNSPHILVLLFILLLFKNDSSSSAAPMPAGTPVSNDLFSQALQQALQATNMSSLQVNKYHMYSVYGENDNCLFPPPSLWVPV